MSIYDLNQAYYLYEDIKELIERIGFYYSIENGKDKYLITSKIKADSKYHWASKESQSVFTKLIPKIKSIHKDMYSLIEAIYKHKNEGVFDKKILAKKYPTFNNFRILNNKFKHYTSGEKEINLTSQIMIGKDYHLIDVYCNFNQPNSELEIIRYSEFIHTFILFLKDNKLISFN